jgi:hypothetical protein
MAEDAARFRKQAEEAGEHAARAHSPLDKEAWLRVVEEWLKLAESAEGRRRGAGRGSKSPRPTNWRLWICS